MKSLLDPLAARIVADPGGMDLSPRPSLKGRELIAQGLSFSPVGETGERLGLSALMPSVFDRALKGEL